MKHGINRPRPLDKGMGEAVARRTVLRKLRPDGSPYTKDDTLQNKAFKWESWGQVAERVAAGNMSIIQKIRLPNKSREKKRLRAHIANGSILMSGRHLQHGDLTQPSRPQEVFTNCSTAATSFLKFYLLLNGSGVGRCYDDDMMVIDWSKIPFIHPVLSEKHADFDYRVHESLEQALHKYGRQVTIYNVQDSREGWAMALEYVEALIFEGGHENEIVLLDFSGVRCKGSLIGGMQLRPSSGPVPTMNAFNAIATLKGCKRPLWWQAMYVDHYMAESVLVGGARRSARIATKHWRDPGIIEFINMKRKVGSNVPLWSANNSVGVDEEFWAEHSIPNTWANYVFNAICTAAYEHGTGEPGIVNLHLLETKRDTLHVQREIGSQRYGVHFGKMLLRRMEEVVATKKYVMIPNPCGEITLYLLGGYCVIGDVAPYHCETIEEFEEAAVLTARALMRTNLMDCVYGHEVKRTNRIGVSLTGIHEYAWKFFGLGFRDMINPHKNQEFWASIARVSLAVREACEKYAQDLGVEVPHTCLTIKPAGTTSKLFGLTEGAHLPSMREFIRWVQFRSDDPLIAKYRKLGYQVRDLRNYEGTTIVGFPTQPTICKIGMGDKLMTAPEATMEEQYQWVQLLEANWLCSGKQYVNYGNQISYTLKYDPKVIDFATYKSVFSRYQRRVRCCSVMPTGEDETAYEYLPEQPVNLDTYNEYVSNIKQEIEEDIDKSHIDCAGGACPVDFSKN
jgi:adenosylcobalamin-dependent ribonucleoside-triphosphate reductase